MVWNMFYDFPFSWEWNIHPNWRSPSFFRGVGQPPTSIARFRWGPINQLIISWRVDGCEIRPPKGWLKHVETPTKSWDVYHLSTGAGFHFIFFWISPSNAWFTIKVFGSTWFNMVQHGSTWFNMVQHGSTWFNWIYYPLFFRSYNGS